MEIFNRPPTISDDTLQYTLYPTEDLSDKASVTTLAVVMQGYAESLLPDMQWHRDAFQLKVVPNPDGQGFVLEGTMRVGDCVDDEWCAVWLLRELSAKWDVVISVFDSDGEFLLIEAAEQLPAWVTPSNAENRVWIYSSHLHLVPLSHVSAPSSKRRRRDYPRPKDSDDEGDEDGLADEEEFLNALDAIRLVRDPLTETRASPAVEEAVWRKVSGYPGAVRMHVHHAKVYLPLDIAKALTVNPALVQKPVETFYTRDAFQLRAAHRMSRFPPEPSVLTTIRLTRTAYAQLVGQKFYPPKVFGRWHEPEGTPGWRWRDVGMKIACGFEMLYQETKGRRGPSESSDSQLSVESRYEALQRNPDFRKFIDNLSASGFFRSELEGSQLWKSLYEKAVAAFIEARHDDDADRASFASQVDTAAREAKDAVLFPDQPEDSDEWLDVNAEDFDAMLQQTFGQPSETKDAPEGAGNNANIDVPQEEDRLAEAQASRLHDLAKKVEEFVEGEGDLQGARFQDELLSDEEPSEEESQESDRDEDVVMSDTLTEEQRVARQKAMDNLVPALEPSDYGKMPPSFYNNSQRVTRTTMETEVREKPAASDSRGHAHPAQRRAIRPPLLPRDEYEGVDSDDESDEEIDEEEEEQQPQVVGEVEIDMEEEEEEFLEFARQALGVSDEQWSEIISERRNRGAFVPEHVQTAPQSHKRAQGAPPTTEQRSSRAHEPGVGAPKTNPNLDSFEAVMQAMDAEFARTRSQTQGAGTNNGKGKAKAPQTEIGDDGDIEAAMEAELKVALERGYEEEDGGDADEEHMDYNLIKNFLESFKSQAGLSGPVSNLAGRLQSGWTLPRDDS
ncbi:hypothetical protein NM688_g7544 [Phlebia brevispora]|uniref:Uncharacterized protein n=1 Tax=Phlebia brevispora TaxID=194682 RepID=A0ACC1S401_9APHY|nr:hypothetical protein NM688_g7544 [Phlebia brevispora]